MTTDTIAQLADDAESVAFTDALARRLDLRRIPFGATETAGAVLAVAPASRQHVREIGLPVVTFSRSAAAPAALQGRVVICGARDECDAPALAIADAIAQVLELPLLAVHVLAAIRAHVHPWAGVPPPHGPTREDRAWAAAMLERLAAAAGVAARDDVGFRVLCGAPASVLATLARSDEAALVVVSGTTRPWVRALFPSVAGHLSRRCERPVLVCPRDAAPAMRVREALGCGM